MRHALRLSVGLLFISGALLSCTSKPHTGAEVARAIRRYDHLLVQMNPDSLALLFTEDGRLGTLAHGRDSIRRAFVGLRKFRVIAQVSTTDAVTFASDTARQTGTYRQTVITPQQDTLRVVGTYAATWRWLAAGGWHLYRIETTPRAGR